MESLSEQLSNTSAEELESTAQRLEAMADALTDANPELAQALRDAATAMRRGDIDAAQEAIGRAAELTQQAGQQIAAQQATKQALGQVQEGRRELAQSGKDDVDRVHPRGQSASESQGQRGQGQQGRDQGRQSQAQGQGGQGRQGSGSGGGQSTSDGGQSASDSDSGDQGGQKGPPADPQGPIPPNQPGQEGETPYDPIYAPERLGGEGGERVNVPGEGEGGPPTGETDGGPRDEGQALVPYNEVYTDYQAQAASALENSYIPRGMKEYVRAYFSSLEPRD